jgi:hypothetical protein
MKHSLVKWLRVAAALGLLAPACWFLAQATLGRDPRIQWKIQQVMLVIWPSSIFLMATDGIEGTPTAYLFIFISVAANVIFYLLVGVAVWWLKNLFASTKK